MVKCTRHCRKLEVNRGRAQYSGRGIVGSWKLIEVGHGIMDEAL